MKTDHIGLKNKVYEIQIPPNAVKNRKSFTEEKVTELINTAIETVQNEIHRKNSKIKTIRASMICEKITISLK